MSLVSWAELKTTLGSQRWSWKPWIAPGHVTLVAGRKGVGKSQVVLDWAGRLVMGKPWPDGTKNENVYVPGDFILWLESESGTQQNIGRCEAFGLPPEIVRMFRAPDRPELPDKFMADSKRLAEVLSAASDPHCKIVVLDALTGTTGADENSVAAAKPVNDLAQIAERSGKPVIIIHHKGKRQRDRMGNWIEETSESIRGSSAIIQKSRIVVSLETPLGDHVQPRRIRQFENNFAAIPEPLGYRLGAAISYCDPPEDLSQPSGTSGRVEAAASWLEERLRDGGLAVVDLVAEGEAAGISQRTLERAKAKLGVKAERVNAIWLWKLPEA